MLVVEWKIELFCSAHRSIYRTPDYEAVSLEGIIYEAHTYSGSMRWTRLELNIFLFSSLYCYGEAAILDICGFHQLLLSLGMTDGSIATLYLTVRFVFCFDLKSSYSLWEPKASSIYTQILTAARSAFYHALNQCLSHPEPIAVATELFIYCLL